jgi:hypothetical protein
MKLTELAQKLKDQKYNDQELSDDTNELACSCGGECFCYSLFEGGYLKPEQWIEGDDLVRLKDAIKVVEEFKNIFEQLQEEF